MKRNNLNAILLALCPISTIAAGCGSTDDSIDDAVDGNQDEEASPRVENVQLTRLAMTSADKATMLRPINIEVELDVAGEPFDSDVLVGLTADDGELGCVLGAMEAKLDEAGASHLTMNGEFLVKGECALLIDRPDVELFASFDPWGEVDVERNGDTPEDVTTIYDVTRASMLGTEECDDCRIETSVSASPGLDAQLREVSLGSSVAVLPVAANAHQTEMPADSRPHFTVSTGTRIDGLDRGQLPDEGEAYLTYRIRPLADASGTEALDANGMGWAPLLERVDSEDGTAQYFEQTAIETKGGHALQHAATVYIGDDMAERMSVGDWHRVNEFELQTCVGTDFDQAIYAGESAPRDNDCATLPVIVARDFVDATGTSVATRTPEGSAKARRAQSYGVSWGVNNHFAGTNYYNGISFVTWLDLNATDAATKTYGGHTVSGPATWFEAGAKSKATVFNNEMTVLNAYVTAIGYNSGAGGIDAKVEALGQTIMDTGYIGSSTGAELTLEQMLAAAGRSTTTTWDAQYPLVGYSFDDGCGTVSAGIFLKGEIGLDNQETKITVSGGANGGTATGVIAPVAAVLAESKASAGYNGFLSVNISLSMAIDILRVLVPFTSTATANLANNTLSIINSADLTISSLSGTIDFAFDYNYPCLKWAGPFPYSGTCSGEHNHNLASWTGPSQTWNLFTHNGGTYTLGSGSSTTTPIFAGFAIPKNFELPLPLGWLGAGTHTVRLSGTGDADLYVRNGEAPTTSAYDCRPYSGGSDEVCTVTLSEPTEVFAMVRGYSDLSVISLEMTEN